LSQVLTEAAPFLASGEDARLRPVRMAGYACGDVTVNTVLVSLSFFFVTYFLTQVAGLRPELAGLVQLVGRGVDAITDPLMGRLSDLCRWKWGRRRPFLVLGALPFGLTFSLIWLAPAESQLGMFAYYTVMYVLLSLSTTVLAVPYLALMPEMALGYDARTSLNMYRNVGSVIGIGAAVAFLPVAQALGGGTEGFALAGAIYGVLAAVPWALVYVASWERPDFAARESSLPFGEGIRLLVKHRNFRILTGLYLCSRISMDIVSAMLVLFFTYVIGNQGDFQVTMGLFLAAVFLSLPVWLRVSRHFDKATLFIIGAVWWAGSFSFLFLAQPDWPRWLLLSFAPVGAIGFAVVDLMVWSMLGDVVDEDDLLSGERREGIYNGAFMFLRKLGGSIAVALAMLLLGAVGFVKNGEQSGAVIWSIRALIAIVPGVFLLLSVWIARGYSLTRERHSDIRARLEARTAVG
jgi:sugar (glycoside-pentoside-hexuronide) transporter